MIEQNKIRNVAIIAHVDHGKTTLVDALLKQTHVFRANQAEMQQECILDRNELEREKGITILAKNVAIEYKGYKINIIDTPGHADFSGEVERTLGMADGALLIVDAQEGPMPQTRFVLKKAIDLELKIIVIVNKIDKKFARSEEVVKKIGNLFLDLATKENQLEFTTLYAVGRTGKIFLERPNSAEESSDVTPLLDSIIREVPPPKNNPDAPFKMLISALDYNQHLGRIAIGRIFQGQAVSGLKVTLNGQNQTLFTLEKILLAQGLEKMEVTEAGAGDIVSLTGIGQAKIGQTVSDPKDTVILTPPAIGEPTLHLELGTNSSPFGGREGKFVTGRQIEERLFRELETNLSLHLQKLESGRFRISGRGELHLAILLESLRREGYEMEVGKPEVITKQIRNKTYEPVEEITLSVPSEYQGVIIRELGQRGGQLLKMEPGLVNELEFVYKLPTRAVLGLRSLLLTATKGTVVLNAQFIGFEPYGAPLPKLRRGVLIASESGTALAYGLKTAQGRGGTFVAPATEVYQGMIVGENSRGEDLEINVVKGKKLTNMRQTATDKEVLLAPPVIFSLEQSLDYLEEDELLEITPKNLRLRKKFLSDIDRRRARRREEKLT